MSKTKGLRRGLALLGVLSLAVVLAVTLFLHRGWRALDLTLEDRSGDPAALRGFQLVGRLNWDHNRDSIHFDLHDGYLDTSFILDDEGSPFVNRAYLYADRSYVVPPERRIAVNLDAETTQMMSGDGYVLESRTDTLLRTYTLKLTLPDGENRTLRLTAGEITLPESVPVEAMDAAAGRTADELDSYYDYTWTAPTPEVEDDWPYSPIEHRPFLLDGSIGICWKENLLGKTPGLYRMNALTDEEIAALPRDGRVEDREVLCGSTAFGSLEPFYCPDDAAEAIYGASMEGDSFLLLYRNTAGVLCADLVDADGQRTDHRELGTLAQGEVDADLEPRTNDRDAVVSLLCQDAEASPDGISGRYLAVLRVKDGQFVLGALLPGSQFAAENGLADVRAAVLNAEGNALLLAHAHYAQLPAPLLGQPAQDGVLLEVRPLEGGDALYRGMLYTGEERDWANIYTPGASFYKDSCYLTFDPLPKDGGVGL